MIKRIFSLFKNPFLHKHKWVQISFGKRRCEKCKKQQWLFANLYPIADEPLYEWKDMDLDF